MDSIHFGFRHAQVAIPSQSIKQDEWVSCPVNNTLGSFVFPRHTFNVDFKTDTDPLTSKPHVFWLCLTMPQTPRNAAVSTDTCWYRRLSCSDLNIQVLTSFSSRQMSVWSGVYVSNIFRLLVNYFVSFPNQSMIFRERPDITCSSVLNYICNKIQLTCSSFPRFC